MDLFEEALVYACEKHAGQRRKSGDLPFIVHPMEVATIVSSMTEDREVLAAAVLHDTVEDAGVTLEEIKERFGERTAMLVASETENKRKDLPPDQTWYIRKKESLDVLAGSTDIGVKMLWLGDKLANMRSYRRQHDEMGDEMWNIYHQKDPKKHEWYYRTIAENLQELKDTYAYKEYVSIIGLIFGD